MVRQSFTIAAVGGGAAVIKKIETKKKPSQHQFIWVEQQHSQLDLQISKPLLSKRKKNPMTKA